MISASSFSSVIAGFCAVGLILNLIFVVIISSSSSSSLESLELVDLRVVDVENGIVL